MAKTEFGQKLSSISANSVYLLKTEDDTIIGIVSLENGVDLNKHVSNLQEHLFEIRDVVGIIGEADPNAKIYANTNFISDTDSRKVCIEKLDAQLKVTNDALNAFIATKGQPNGLAELDATGRIPSSQLTLEAFEYKGNWDASLNSPTLIDGTGNTGDTYHVTSDATVDLGSGNIVFKAGFKVVYNGATWEAWETLNEVKTVNSVSPDGAGNVALDTGDIPEGTNQYYTEARVSANTSVTANTAKISADGSIDTHSDVDISTVAPNTGEVLKYDGANFVPAEDGGGFDAVDTKANLLALPREAGKLYYATDEGLAYVDDGVNLNPVGSGGGKVLKDFIVPTASATTITFPNEAYTYGSGQNLFYRNGSLMTRELASGDTFSTNPDLASFEYKEIDNGDASTQIEINPNASASGDTEFSMVTHVKLAGASGSLTAKGDLLTYDTEDVILPVGNDGQVLTADSIAPKGIKWSDLVSLPILAKGSLVSSNGVNNGELTVGSDGAVLKADSSEPSGIKWELSSGGAETASIITYTSDVAPSGYILCDGSAVSRTTYASLYAIIGDAYGEGDGSTTFNIPDLRGRFLRGKDGGAGNDPDSASRTASGTNGNTGDAVGSLQADDFDSHTHTGQLQNTTGNASTPASVNSFAIYTGAGNPFHQSNPSHAINVINNTGGNETRPKNINVNYMIKY